MACRLSRFIPSLSLPLRFSPLQILLLLFFSPCSLPLSLCSVPFLSFSLSHALPFILFLFHSRKDRFCFNWFRKEWDWTLVQCRKRMQKKKRKNKRKKKERELKITKLYRTFYRAVFFKYWPDSSDAPMVLDARMSYYFSIVVPSDCLLIPRPYLSGKIAHPRLVQKHNETGRNRAEPFRLFISPPRSPTVISSGAVSSIQFILQRESTRRVYTPHFV